jgi:hypothetical protein
MSEEIDPVYDNAIKKRCKKFVDVKVTRIERIYVEEEISKETEIKVNEDQKTYSLSAVYEPKYAVDDENDFELDGYDIKKFASKLKMNDIVATMSYYDEGKFIKTMDNDKIKKEYTEGEFKEAIKLKYLIEIDEAFKKANKKPIHSKKCECEECTKNDDSSSSESE